MALSPVLQPAEVLGVDPNHSSLEAAAVRAQSYDLPPQRVEFLPTAPGEPLPFEDGLFHLTVCVSVLEYVRTLQGRRRLVNELTRVTRPNGYIFLATPNPFRIRDYHTGRFLGDFRRRDGYPWSSTPGQLRELFHGLERLPLHGYLCRRGLRKVGLSPHWFPGWAASLVAWASPWQRILARKLEGVLR
jgi:ubiquinone/menaquinone biosynthesis C-methylase UbiE